MFFFHGLVEFEEVLTCHVDFASYDARFVGGCGYGDGNGGYGDGVGGDVFAYDSVASCGGMDECSVFVGEGEGESVNFGF